jgi:transcriptional regulator with XRE-family HTH domain
MLHNVKMEENKKYKTIGNFIRAKREDLQITQEALSKAIGVSPATISLYESGDRKPEIPVLEKIADELNTSLAAILDIEIKDTDLDIALRAQDLEHQDISKVREYIKMVKYARQQQNSTKQT